MFDEATEIAERVRVRPLDPRADLFVGVHHLPYKPDLVRINRSAGSARDAGRRTAVETSPAGGDALTTPDS